jgi:hypothetical protein
MGAIIAIPMNNSQRVCFCSIGHHLLNGSDPSLKAVAFDFFVPTKVSLVSPADNRQTTAPIFGALPPPSLGL